MKIVTADCIEKLWLNLLIDVCCGENYFDHPVIYTRHTFATTENFESDKMHNLNQLESKLSINLFCVL